MNFRSLFIHGYGVFSDELEEEKRHFKFKKNGINLVLGDNEKGKTTLMEAIFDTLYGIPSRQLNLRKPWKGKSFGAVLEFEVRDKIFKVERDFSKEYVELYRWDGDWTPLFKGISTPSKKRKSFLHYYELLKEMGVIPRKLFFRLAFVKSMEMEKDISEEIRKLITGNSQISYDNVVDKLKSKYFEITKFDPWKASNKTNPRLLEKLKEEYKNLQRTLEDAQNRYMEVLKKEAELERLKEDVHFLEAERERLLKVQKDVSEFLKVRNEIDEVSRRLEEKISVESKIDRYMKKRQEVENLLNEEDLSVFEGVDKNIEDICQELIYVDRQIKTCKATSLERKKAIEKYKTDIAEKESLLSKEYSSLASLPSSFEEKYEQYLQKKERLERDIKIYQKNKKEIEHLLDELDGVDFLDLRTKGDDFKNRLLELSKIEKEIERVESQKLSFKEEYENTKNALANALEMIQKNYPYMDKLPPDIHYTIQEYKKIKEEEKKREEETEKIKLNIKNIETSIKSPLNILLLVGALLGFISGFVFGKIGAILGGAVFILFVIVLTIRVKPLFSQRLKLLGKLEVLQGEKKKDVPYLDIPEPLREKYTLDELLERRREYRAALRSVENLREKLQVLSSQMEDEGSLEELRDKLKKELKDISLPEDVSPTDALHIYEDVHKIQEKLKHKKDFLKTLFSEFQNVEIPPLPDKPLELVELEKEIMDFERQYPIVKQINSFDDIKDKFSNMLVLKGEVEALRNMLEFEMKRDTEEDISSLLSKRTSLLNTISPLVGKFGENPSIILERYKEYVKIKEEFKVIDNLSSVLQERDVIKKDISKLTTDLVVLRKYLDDLLKENPALSSYTSVSPLEVHKMLEEVNENLQNIEKTLAKKKERKRSLEVEISYFSLSTNPYSIKEQMNELEEKIEKYELLRKAYEVGIDVLAESIDEFQRNYRKDLESLISQVFCEITSGRYTGVSLDTHFNIKAKKGDFEIEKENLSSGTKDQLFFAMRIALAEYMASMTSIPLLLDDPFTSFDKNRRDRARQLLKEISKRHQVILFTHDDSYISWADNLCHLE